MSEPAAPAATYLDSLQQKKIGQPLSHYNLASDTLIVLMGDGDCRSYQSGGLIADEADVLLKMSPRPNEDTFAGVQVWGGVSQCISRHYLSFMKEKYPTYREEHNRERHLTDVSEIFTLCLRAQSQTPLMEKYRGRIYRALQQQNPEVHIPLLEEAEIKKEHNDDQPHPDSDS